MAYAEEIQEIRDWLSDGEKSASDFDAKFRLGHPFIDPTSCKAVDRGSYVLGSIKQGMGPNTWAGRLDLLHGMIHYKEVVCEERDGQLYYRLC